MAGTSAAPALRADMAIPTWNGKTETLEDYATAVELLTLGSSKEMRPLLGLRLVAALPQGSAQQRFALRLPREAGLDMDGAPMEPKSIAIAGGPNNLIEAFRRELGIQVVSGVVERTDADFHAGPGRSALTRRLGQSMAQRIETEEEAYDQLQQAENDLAVRGKKRKPGSRRVGHCADEIHRQTYEEQGNDFELPPDEYAQADEED
ncbi:unnamed protein product, partial [Prorocentrum cordatum]